MRLGLSLKPGPPHIEIFGGDIKKIFPALTRRKIPPNFRIKSPPLALGPTFDRLLRVVQGVFKSNQISLCRRTIVHK